MIVRHHQHFWQISLFSHRLGVYILYFIDLLFSTIYPDLTGFLQCIQIVIFISILETIVQKKRCSPPQPCSLWVLHQRGIQSTLHVLFFFPPLSDVTHCWHFLFKFMEVILCKLLPQFFLEKITSINENIFSFFYKKMPVSCLFYFCMKNLWIYFVCRNLKSLATFTAVIRDIRRGRPKMSKIILIIFFFSYKNIFREFKMKHFNGEQTVAATISRIFYKYQRNDDWRARVRVPSCGDRSQTYSCRCIVSIWMMAFFLFFTTTSELSMLGIVCLQRFLAMHRPNHFINPSVAFVLNLTRALKYWRLRLEP